MAPPRPRALPSPRSARPADGTCAHHPSKYAQFRKYKEDDASGLTAKAACVLFEQTDFSAACSAGGSTGEYEVWNIYPPSA